MYPTRGVMQLVAVIPLLRFFIMNISVCFLEKVKIDMLFNFYIFINVTIFFYRACKIPTAHRHPWANAGFCPWEQRDFHQRSAPSLSSRVKTHPASVLLMLLVLLNNFSCFTGELDHFSCCDTPECSHSPRDYGQVPDNWFIFVDYLLVIYLR